MAVVLRPFEEQDLVLLDRFATEPGFSEPFEWTGYRSKASHRRRWEEDGFLDKDPHQLVVADQEGSPLGWVMWRDPHLFARPEQVWEVGIVLAPEHRGKGVGTEAQRLLADYLFANSDVHRLCAYTETDNVAEQRALERVGFRREGVLREAGFRGGEVRDVVLYGCLRSDLDE